MAAAMSPAPIIIVLIALVVPFSVHKVKEGHVGVYYRGGAMLNGSAEPGYNVMMPFVTSFANVQVTVQTDKVINIPCGTHGGVVIYFERIEVVNRLKKDRVHSTVKEYGVNYDQTWIFDKIHHEINQLCSKHTLQDVYIEKFDTVDDTLRDALQQDLNKYQIGLEILSVRVTKPKIPESIRRNYESMEAEKTKLLVASQQQRVIEKQAETERLRVAIEAKSKQEVSSIRQSQAIEEKSTAAKIATIENEMEATRIRTIADAEFYRTKKKAEANKLIQTKEYIQLELARAVSNNAKMFFGEKIPNMLFDHGLQSAAAASASSTN